MVPRSPLGLHPRIGAGRGQHAARRGVRRDRHHVQHGYRHDRRAERHSAGTEPEGGHPERRPDHPHRRLARGRPQAPDGRGDADAARPPRHTGDGVGAAQGRRRAPPHDHRTRQDSGEERRCRLHAHPRGGFPAHHHLLATHPRRDGTSPGRPARRGHAEADRRPARQHGRLPRPAHPHGQRIPPRRPAHRLHRRPQRRSDGGVQRRKRGVPGCGASGPDRRTQRLVERNLHRRPAGQRPRHHHRPPLLRQRPRPAADSLLRRLGHPADHGPLLHPHGAFHPEALYRRRQRLRTGHLQPLPAQRALFGRQHPFRRQPEVRDARRQDRLRRRGHHARPLRPARHHRNDRLLHEGGRTEHPLPLHHGVCRPQPHEDQRREERRRTRQPAQCRHGHVRRLRTLCRPQRRGPRCAADTPLGKAAQSPVTRLHRPQHPVGGDRLLRQLLRGGRSGAEGPRSVRPVAPGIPAGQRSLHRRGGGGVCLPALSSCAPAMPRSRTGRKPRFSAPPEVPATTRPPAQTRRRENRKSPCRHASAGTGPPFPHGFPSPSSAMRNARSRPEAPKSRPASTTAYRRSSPETERRERIFPNAGTENGRKKC